MNWYEKIKAMSLDEMAEFLGTSKHEDFICLSCENCVYKQDDGFCGAAKADCLDSACTAAMKYVLLSEVSNENK